MNSSQPIVSVTNQETGGFPETTQQRDKAMARVFRFLGMPELAELYEPRPGRFVADKIHRFKPASQDFDQEKNNDV